MRSQLTVGLAQIDSRLGALEHNVSAHLEWIEKAREAGVEVLLFPELSLTGYRLLHLTSRVALDPDDAEELAVLSGAAGEMAVVVGFVEKGSRGVLYNSAAVLQNGAIQSIHRKVYLPTYGIFQEGRFMGPGKDLRLLDICGVDCGLLICEDVWHPHLAQELALAGARVLLVISAGPGRISSAAVPESQDTWEVLTRATALVNTMWVLYCNRTGWEEGSFYPGGSHIVQPGGTVLERAPFLQESLLVSTIDLGEVERLRWRLPLLSSRRSDIRGPQ